jgi:signal transduction histidine kinase
VLDRLERSVDSQRRFVANASHELRTPLAIQRAASRSASPIPRRTGSPQVRQQLLSANHRGERLIDALLVLAHSERGLDGREPVALDELVRKAVRDVSSGEVEIAVEVEPVGGCPEFRGTSVAAPIIIRPLPPPPDPRTDR